MTRAVPRIALISAANRPEPYPAVFDDRARTWRDFSGVFCVDVPLTCHPLAVIDPEDLSAVERLRAAHFDLLGGPSKSAALDAMQAALRSLITPPKPDEPMGLGAVVEDDDGEMWVRDRTTTMVNHWKRARGGDGGRRYSYSDLSVVRVLSEGVHP